MYLNIRVNTAGNIIIISYVIAADNPRFVNCDGVCIRRTRGALITDIIDVDSDSGTSCLGGTAAVRGLHGEDVLYGRLVVEGGGHRQSASGRVNGEPPGRVARWRTEKQDQVTYNTLV